MITTLENLGSEYEIKFQLFISKLENTKKTYNILTFSVDNGKEDKNHRKKGDRIPAVFIKDKELIIAAAVNKDPNFQTKVPIIVDSWIKIEICQHLISDKAGGSLVHFQPNSLSLYL